MADHMADHKDEPFICHITNERALDGYIVRRDEQGTLRRHRCTAWESGSCRMCAGDRSRKQDLLEDGR